LVDKCGTPAFMAPEQHLLPRKSNGYTFPVDLWAAGLLMYMLMENRHPFLNAKGMLEMEQLMNGHLVFSGRRSTQSTGFFSALFSDRSDCHCLADSQERFSEAARRFCRYLVCPNPANRFTAKAALHDPWLSEYKREPSGFKGPRTIAAPEETPDGWMWHRASGGRVFWHHASLGPAPWESNAALCELTPHIPIETDTPQHQVRATSRNQAAGPELQVPPPPPPGPPPPSHPESNACSNPDNDGTSVNVKLKQWQGLQAMVDEERSNPPPTPRSAEPQARSKRDNDSKYVKLKQAIFGNERSNPPPPPSPSKSQARDISKQAIVGEDVSNPPPPPSPSKSQARSKCDNDSKYVKLNMRSLLRSNKKSCVI